MTNNCTINMGGLSVVANGYNARNDNDPADTVVQRINEMLMRSIRCGAGKAYTFVLVLSEPRS